MRDVLALDLEVRLLIYIYGVIIPIFVPASTDDPVSAVVSAALYILVSSFLGITIVRLHGQSTPIALHGKPR